MKKIQPFNIWVNGQTKTALYMSLVLNNDNLLNQAVFYWAFYDEQQGKPGNKITDGNITLQGADYIAYNTSSNSNNYAWNWAAQTLGVTLIP
jgi:hypothetical protein